MNPDAALILSFALVVIVLGATTIALVVIGLRTIAELNARLADTRLTLWTLIQDLHFIHRIPMSSFPDVLEGVGSGDTDQEGRHGSGETR